MSVKMNAEELQVFLGQVFGEVAEDFVVEDAREMHATLRMLIKENHLRPGGTVSGPSMFAVADVAMYIAVLAMVGPKALAVTTSMSMDFMRKPVSHADLIAECELLKLGKVLAVGEVRIFSEGMAEPVARAGLTYSIPKT